ncbi:hypothetical protein [Synechococcus sp. UW179A]|uniref:hypothetical protein n=1 Tax=Synechococcus sp. UW179A TaxID=2575510 RepID=UPI000E0F942E|nr:hypothetical protein [Synechococcus sp. UW179A]
MQSDCFEDSRIADPSCADGDEDQQNQNSWHRSDAENTTIAWLVCERLLGIPPPSDEGWRHVAGQ